ncbi:trypsin-like serine peptidase [Pseudomonas alloputida]|uniref:trypsin-like serine peptidase n=1 Tax=Pseudomonas TaxID=286 RepID=UPI003EEEEBAD
MKRLITHLASAGCMTSYLALAAPIESPEQNEAQVLQFWTPERMQEAEFAGGGPANPVKKVLTDGGDHFGFASVTHAQENALSRRAGILFYVSSDGVLQHCSATALDSAKGNLILTAAHCVIEQEGKWKDKSLFVPAYDGAAAPAQRTPLGRWPVHYKYIPTLNAYATIDTDLAIASVFAQEGKSLKEALAGASQPCISESQQALPVGQVWAYPGVSYLGGEMKRCVSRLNPEESSSGILTPNCATMSGSSGAGFRLQSQQNDWVAGVVHGTGQSARLRQSTFNDLYKVANGSEVDVAACEAP